MDIFKWSDISSEEVISLLDGIYASDKFKSKGEARRLIEQGAVRINQEQVLDPFHKISKSVLPVIIQAGKRIFLKIVN